MQRAYFSPLGYQTFFSPVRVLSESLRNMSTARASNRVERDGLPATENKEMANS